jgi:hypothetical protein
MTFRLSARALTVSILGLSMVASMAFMPQSLSSPHDDDSQHEASETFVDWNEAPVGLNALGPIHVGMTVAEAQKASGLVLEREANYDTDACYYVAPNSGPTDVGVMVTEGVIARFDVWDGKRTTISGIGIGSTEDQVKQIYGKKLSVERHHYDEHGHYLVFTPTDDRDAQYRMVFETDGKKVIGIRTGKLPEAFYVEGCS